MPKLTHPFHCSVLFWSEANLAAQLGDVLTSQGITEIFGERANPTSEQTLAILEYLKKDMSPQTVCEPSKVRTLTEPRETIELQNSTIADLSAEISRLKLGTPTIPTRATTPTPTAPPASKSPTASVPTAWEREVARAHKARTAGLSNKPLAEQTVAELRAALNAATDPAKVNEIYNYLKRAERAARLERP
jgi:hypothetical protein